MASHLIFSTILLAISSMMGLTHVAAVVYTVGDEDGWSTGTNYLLWSEQHNFTVGDVLVFNYVEGQHNVYQVRKETFRTCNSSTGVIRAYFTGSDQVELAKAMEYFFICNLEGHCQGGMKLGVSVASSTGSGELPGPESVPPPPAVVVTDLPGNGSPAAGGMVGWGRCVVVGLVMLAQLTFF